MRRPPFAFESVIRATVAIRSPRRERQSEIRFLHRSHDESGFHSAEFLRLPEFHTLGFFYDYERNNLRILKRILLLSPLCRRKIMVSCLEWNSRTFAFLPPFRAMEEGGRRVTVASRTRSTTFDRECLLRAASIMERKRGRGRESRATSKGTSLPREHSFFARRLTK